ncbi:serine/threonine protein kinase [Luteimonas aestuarii]|uniref:Serine/threonine protein kinase n=1 Tax=Luteimonas aestuarii TaxID=453837 RepID=A0A4R5TVC7_9GAMM|nr:serine/threonine protein kinase [Luteimonas aestuarii]TDK25043.1 serine/threonine protein kinase [Luteimonas aestuarii]
MDTTMELDELKRAWQSLGRQLERHDAIQLQLLRDSKLDKARRSLRPLLWGQCLQLLLGVGLIALGVACWTRSTDMPALLATGIVVHAFGVAHVALAGIVMGLAGSIDYGAPVLDIHKRTALLMRLQAINGHVCGAPWWVMWVVVVVAFAGLGDGIDPTASVPAWISISLAVGVAGLLATWGWSLWSWRTRRRAMPGADTADRADGCDGIRRSQRHLEELARFERE